MPFVNLKLSVIPQVISGGLPRIKEDGFIIEAHRKLKLACEQAVLLFLDELSLNQDNSLVLSLLFGDEALDFSLHPGTYIVSATNYGSAYDTNNLPIQLLARFAVFNLYYSIDNFNYIIQKHGLYHLAPLASKVVKAWQEGDNNEDILPIECPRTFDYAMFVVDGLKNKIINENLAVKMLTGLTQFVDEILTTSPEASAVHLIKNGLWEKINFYYDINEVFDIIINGWETFTDKEKIETLKFIVECNVPIDIKSGVLTQLLEKSSAEFKVNLPKNLIDKITKIVSGFIA